MNKKRAGGEMGNTGNYRELQGITGKYREIQGNTGNYMELHGITGKICRRFFLLFFVFSRPQINKKIL